jgi:D-glycero-D-manno-heptose 1,7-bisphosphate phosphatase
MQQNGSSLHAMNRAVFLDRDGVINRAPIRDGLPVSPRNLNNLEILPGVETALNGLKRSGFLLIVVTNQPDVARGIISITEVHEINNFLSNSLPIDGFFVCAHDNQDYCTCRKPKSGLLLDAAIQFRIDTKSSYLVGDRWRDIEAGQAVGCACYFIDYGYPEKSPKEPFKRVFSLLEASHEILGVDNNADTK